MELAPRIVKKNTNVRIVGSQRFGCSSFFDCLRFTSWYILLLFYDCSLVRLSLNLKASTFRGPLFEEIAT